ENVPWGMAPGRWMLNSTEEAIYYWSNDGQPPQDVGVSCGLMEYIRVEGQIDHDGPVDIPVKGLVFRGLTFTQGARYTFPADYKGTRWQHDWAGYDEASALLRFRGAENCVVENCRFVNSGATGVRLDLYAQNITVRGNEFAHLGESGVILSGYGPGTKDVNKNNIIENNWFHHGSEEYLHASAILMAQSGGNTVRYNLIHDYNYNGITVTGLRRFDPGFDAAAQESQRLIRWHEFPERKFMEFPDTVPFLYGRNNRIEDNEIFRVVEGLGDGCAIYLSCAGDGNVVRHNYVHHLRGDAASALRSDDAQWNVTYESNVVYKTTGHGIILKGPNRAVNNFIIDQQEQFLDWIPNSISLAIRTGPYRGIEVKRNIYAQFGERIPQFYYLTDDGNGSLQDASVDSNLFWWQHNPAAASNVLTSVRNLYGFDAHGKTLDPLFMDIQAGDFRLKPESPALAMGIESIDISTTGLTGEFRAKVCQPSPDEIMISPESQVFTGAVTVAMTGGDPDGEIRYTLDGREPDEQSALYHGPFSVTQPGIIRARSFRKGSADRLGARLNLWPSTQPVLETFECESDGVSRSRFVFAGELVSLAQDPVREGSSLCFKDLGAGNRYEPFGFYQILRGNGGAEITFDVWLGTNAQLTVQWSDNISAGPGTSDTCISIEDQGRIFSSKDRMVVGKVALEQWATVSLRLSLSAAETGSPALLVDGELQPEFSLSLAAESVPFLQKIIFSSSGTQQAVLYLDNIRIQALTEDE
ncbi:MAG: right-handed parallel beta-helix repeat-containing protein, partial [Kiritimatiellales bacterium]